MPELIASNVVDILLRYTANVNLTVGLLLGIAFGTSLSALIVLGMRK